MKMPPSCCCRGTQTEKGASWNGGRVWSRKQKKP